MVVDPMQGGMGLPLYLLEHTPFDDFLIPGIILGFFNGILSLVFAILVARKHPYQAWFILFQGAVLSIWLITEVLMGIFYALLTIPYALVAILLIGSGLLMKLSKTGLS